MKKLLSLLAVAVLFFAAGCESRSISDAKTPPPIPEVFSSNLKIAYGDTAMNAVINQLTNGETEIQMTSPEILAPLKLCYKDGGCTVTYDGLTFETDLNRFPQVSFGTLLINTLYDIKQGIDIQTTFADGIWTYKGTGDRGIFVMTRDAESGAWLSLSIEGASLHAEFTDFKSE